MSRNDLTEGLLGGILWMQIMIWMILMMQMCSGR